MGCVRGMKSTVTKSVRFVLCGWFLLGIIGSLAGETIRVASISFEPEKFGIEGNADRLAKAFRLAAAKGAQLAVAPEGILDGYVVNEIIAGEVVAERMKDVAIPIEGPMMRRFRDLARELRMCLAFGFARLIGTDVFNAAVFIDHRGEIAGTYHKMQFHEGYHPDWWFNRLGENSRAFETPFGRCGFMICNDRWNPDLARIPSLDGAQFLLIPAFGSRSAAQDDAVRDRSRENGIPIIEANVGVRLIVDADGEVLAADREMEGVTISDLEIPTARSANPAERDALESQFKAWREKEMSDRYQATLKRIQERAK